jgi:hypothetical protein
LCELLKLVVWNEQYNFVKRRKTGTASARYGKCASRGRTQLCIAPGTGALAPVVLWIDEIEKAFASTESSGDGDAGLVAEIHATQPLSVTRAEEIAAIRDWAKNRAVSAG